jgi:uncharacterized protein involved in exopolysaccharide biosynthesis
VVEKFQLYQDRKRWLSTTDIIDHFKSRIQILPLDFKSPNPRSNRVTIAFTVRFEHERPDVAARVANELVTRILSEDVRARTSQANETTKFLTREVGRLEGELRSVEAKLAVFKQRNAEALPGRAPTQVSALAIAEKRVADLDNAIRQLEYERRMLESGASAVSNVEELNKQLSLLKLELVQRGSLYADSHPNIKTIKLQIAAIERELAGGSVPATNKSKTLTAAEAQANAQKIAAIESRLRHVSDQRTVAEKAVNEFRTKANEAEVGLNTLERQHAGIQRDLEEAGRKLSAARLGESLERDQQSERFEIIENPTVPQKPHKPNRILVLALAIGMALSSGVAGIFAAEMIDKSIRTRDELSRIVDSHLIVAIPYITTREELNRRKGKIVAIAGCALTIIVGLIAIYVLTPSIGIVIRSTFTRVMG